MPEARRRAPVLDDGQAAELARLGVQIERLYEMPMDIEWALAEGKFAILQARPDHGAAQARPPSPDEWTLPDRATMSDAQQHRRTDADPADAAVRHAGAAAINTGLGD